MLSTPVNTSARHHVRAASHARLDSDARRRTAISDPVAKFATAWVKTTSWNPIRHVYISIESFDTYAAAKIL